MLNITNEEIQDMEKRFTWKKVSPGVISLETIQVPNTLEFCHLNITKFAYNKFCVHYADSLDEGTHFAKWYRIEDEAKRVAVKEIIEDTKDRAYAVISLHINTIIRLEVIKNCSHIHIYDLELDKPTSIEAEKDGDK